MEQWKNKGLFAKTIYSLNGLRTAFLTEKAIRHESLGVVVAVSLALFMERGWSDVLCVFLASLFPMTVELINTAVERIIDTHFGPAYREEVRIQKDTLSAAVFMRLIIGYGLCIRIIFFK